MALTNIKIRNSSPGKKTQKLFDERGLYLEVSPNGGKWWRLKYRFNGKEKRLSMGVYPDVSLKDARERRDEARKLVANGIDPSEHRKTIKTNNKENFFEGVACEWFAKHSSNWAEDHGTGSSRVAFDLIYHGPMLGVGYKF
jgi:Arm domain-containing DNA-binding protein